MKFVKPTGVPEKIIAAFNSGTLALFLGAGISRLNGLQGWDELAKNLITKSSCFSFMEKEQILSSINNPKQLITIAYHTSENKHKKDEFYETFAKAFVPAQLKKDVYRSISKLNTMFLTTNADNELAKHLGDPREYIDFEKPFPPISSLKSPCIVYLHGKYGETEQQRESLVFTADRYINQYNTENFTTFLEKVFNEKTVLFLGYGLNEFELLDHLLKKVAKKNNKKHFILEGFFSYEKAVYNARKIYYAALNINLIPYSKDNTGYFEQVNIIEGWVKTLMQQANYNPIVFEQIRSFVSSSEENPDLIKHYLDEPSTHDSILALFCSEILNKDNYFFWIKTFKTMGLFEQERCPKVKRLPENFYKAVFWEELSLLYQLIYKYNTDKELREFAASIINNLIPAIIQEKELMANYSVINEIFGIILNLQDSELQDFYFKFISLVLSNNGTSDFYSLKENQNFTTWNSNNFKYLIEAIFNNYTDNDIDIFCKDIVPHLNDEQLKIILQKFTAVLKDDEEHNSYTFSYSLLENCFGPNSYNKTALLTKNYIKIWEKLNPLDKQNAIELLLNSNSGILIKFAAHFMNAGSYGLDFLVLPHSNIFNYYVAFLDIYNYLQNNVNNISEKSLNDIVNLIENITIQDSNGRNEQELTNRTKTSYLELLAKKDSTLTSKFEKYKTLLIYPYRPPDLTDNMRGNFNTIKVSNDYEDFSEKSLEQIQDFINRTAPTDFIVRSVMNYLANEICRDINIVISLLFNSEITKAIKIYCAMSLNSQKTLNLNNDFFERIALQSIEHFLPSQAEERELIIKYCLDLLLKNDKRNMAQSIEVAKKIMASGFSEDDLGFDLSFIEDALHNSLWGKAIDLYIFSIAVSADKNSVVKVSSEQLDFLNKLLQKDTTGFVRLCFARQSQNLLYLNRDWHNNNLSTFFDGTKHFEAIAVYLANTNLILQEVIDYLTKNELYLNLFDNIVFKNVSVSSLNRYYERLIEYLLWAYIFEYCDEAVIKNIVIKSEESVACILDSILLDAQGLKTTKIEELFYPIMKYILESRNFLRKHVNHIFRFIIQFQTKQPKYYALFNKALDKIATDIHLYKKIDALKIALSVEGTDAGEFIKKIVTKANLRDDEKNELINECVLQKKESLAREILDILCKRNPDNVKYYSLIVNRL